ncbi:MAG: acetyl-CoA C-acyltransferase [Flavobacteriales bacterium]
MREAYIVTGYRTAVGRAPRGSLRFTRTDEMAAATIKRVLADVPDLNKDEIDDVIVGNAMPEAEQGLNIGRIISLLALDTVAVPGLTINRYCASGSESIATAVAKIRNGMGECIIAGGAESMSYIPMGGFKPVPAYQLVHRGHEDYYYNMGLTAEAVAQAFHVSREDQDAFAFTSHQRACKAQAENRFEGEIAPLDIAYTTLENGKKTTRSTTFTKDEGPRADSSREALAKLRPVFAQGGTVTAGNSSQTSDGAAFTLIMSESMVKRYELKPLARLVSYATAGVEPRIMGIAPVEAVPKALKSAGMKLRDIELVELNEAFASQSLAVIRQLELNPEITNVNGGAIALGHPLGCTGTKLTVQLLNEMQKRGNRYGLVTMCVGTGQGAASIFELLN